MVPLVLLSRVTNTEAARVPVSVRVIASFPKPLIPVEAYAVFISAAAPVIVVTSEAVRRPGTLPSVVFNKVAVIVVSEIVAVKSVSKLILSPLLPSTAIRLLTSVAVPVTPVIAVASTVDPVLPAIVIRFAAVAVPEARVKVNKSVLAVFKLNRSVTEVLDIVAVTTPFVAA